MDCKEIQPIHSEDQPWNFFGRNDAKAETPVLWPPHEKSWLIEKDSDAGRDWGQEEKGTTEDDMAGWHHWLDGCESEWTPGVGDGQGGLACCDSWGRKESDTTERLIWSDLIVTFSHYIPNLQKKPLKASKLLILIISNLISNFNPWVLIFLIILWPNGRTCTYKLSQGGEVEGKKKTLCGCLQLWAELDNFFLELHLYLKEQNRQTCNCSDLVVWLTYQNMNKMNPSYKEKLLTIFVINYKIHIFWWKSESWKTRVCHYKIDI